VQKKSSILTAYFRSLIRLKMIIVTEAIFFRNLNRNILQVLSLRMMANGAQTISSFNRGCSVYVCEPQPDLAQHFLN
jgi:hypothetical protein